MEHAELSSSVIFVCHVNFSRRLEAESAAISVLFNLANLNILEDYQKLIKAINLEIFLLATAELNI